MNTASDEHSAAPLQNRAGVEVCFRPVLCERRINNRRTRAVAREYLEGREVACANAGFGYLIEDAVK